MQEAEKPAAGKAHSWSPAHVAQHAWRVWLPGLLAAANPCGPRRIAV